MRLKAPLNPVMAELDREQQLRDFIRSALEAMESGPAEILLLARAPESLAAKVLFSLSEELSCHQVSGRVIFAGGALVQTGEAWHLRFDPEFSHEISLLRDARFLDGHEQLVIGNVSLWFGDSMRREPDKRDAFASYRSGDALAVERARTTFDRIWALAEPVYVHSIEAAQASSEVVAAVTALPSPAGSEQASSEPLLPH